MDQNKEGSDRSPISLGELQSQVRNLGILTRLFIRDENRVQTKVAHGRFCLCGRSTGGKGTVYRNFRPPSFYGRFFSDFQWLTVSCESWGYSRHPFPTSLNRQVCLTRGGLVVVIRDVSQPKLCLKRWVKGREGTEKKDGD